MINRNNYVIMIKNTFIFLCLLVISSFTSFSQTKIDTVYVKSIYSTTNTIKDSASYYRVRTIADGVLKAEDYRIEDSVMKCSGYYKSFDPYVKHGYFYFYSTDTMLVSSEGNYEEDKLSGVWKNYYSTSELWYTATYDNGIRSGMLKGYYKTGEVKRIEQYKKGKRVKGKCYTKSGKDTVYYEMYIMPSFPGGEKAMVRYILSKLQYPEQARINKIQGTVYISYVVNTDGSIIDVEVVKGREVHPLLDSAAQNCIKNMPTWTPGYVEGSPVKVKRMQKIKFTLPG